MANNIKNMEIRQVVAFKSNSEAFRRISEVGNMDALSPSERRSYEADIKNVRDTLNQIRGAYEEGLRQGLEEARMEERRENIKMMLSFGVPFEAIADQFGMTTAEITKLID